MLTVSTGIFCSGSSVFGPGRITEFYYQAGEHGPHAAGDREDLTGEIWITDLGDQSDIGCSSAFTGFGAAFSELVSFVWPRYAVRSLGDEQRGPGSGSD